MSHVNLLFCHSQNHDKEKMNADKERIVQALKKEKTGDFAWY